MPQMETASADNAISDTKEPAKVVLTPFNSSSALHNPSLPSCLCFCQLDVLSSYFAPFLHVILLKLCSNVAFVFLIWLQFLFNDHVLLVFFLFFYPMCLLCMCMCGFLPCLRIVYACLCVCVDNRS